MGITFDYKGWTLSSALNALQAYDDGATDSGVHDPAMKQALREFLRALPDEEFRLQLSRHVRETYLTEARLEQRYGIEDVAGFLRWLEDELGWGF